MMPLMPSPGSPKTISTPHSIRVFTNESAAVSDIMDDLSCGGRDAAASGLFVSACWLSVEGPVRVGHQAGPSNLGRERPPRTIRDSPQGRVEFPLRAVT